MIRFANNMLLVVVLLTNLLLLVIFVFRVKKQLKWERMTGIILQILVVPYFIILVIYINNNQELWIIIGILLMIVFLLVELFLDYILSIKFREIGIIVGPYLLLYYASLWVLIGAIFTINILIAIICLVIYFAHTYLAIYSHRFQSKA